MVQNDALIPLCTYSVHRDSPNGPLVKFTRVGEQLYHGKVFLQKKFDIFKWAIIVFLKFINTFYDIIKYYNFKKIFLLLFLIRFNFFEKKTKQNTYKIKSFNINVIRYF